MKTAKDKSVTKNDKVYEHIKDIQGVTKPDKRSPYLWYDGSIEVCEKIVDRLCERYGSPKADHYYLNDISWKTDTLSITVNKGLGHCATGEVSIVVI